jgi:rhamnosyltransferase
MLPWIVMRSKNDNGLVQRTVAGLKTQDHPYRLLVMDNASTDHSAEFLQSVADRFITVPEGQYVPGRVLNQGMRETDGEFVVFLNSDCIPLHPQWLSRLLAGFDSDDIVAVFGRQEPRPDCTPLLSKDTEDTFGDGRRQAHWRHCFSMATSALRRTAWERMPFDEHLRYSEDIDWTWRARQAGGRIRYVADSRVEHSHNYTLSQFYRRHRGEGEAEARIFEWSGWDASWVRYSFLPFLRQMLGDFKYAVRERKPTLALQSPALRLAQMLGRRAGFQKGRSHASRP